MKKFFIIIILLALLAIVMKITVPTPEKHKEVAKERLTEMVMDKLSDFDGAKEALEDCNIDLNILIKMGLTQLKMKDYFVCNAGFIKYDGEEYMVTLGMFNHVFVTTDYIDEVQEANEKLEELKKKFD